MNALDALFGQNKGPLVGTPGFNPNAPDPRVRAPTPENPLDKFLGTSGGSLLMNLLSQQGFSRTPQSPFGALGRGLQQTQAQRQGNIRSNIEDELLRSRIGLNKAQTQKAGKTGASQRIVQSAQTLANGNIGFLNAFTGEVVDTKAKAGGRGQIIDMPGLGQVIYDPTTNTLTQANPEDVIRIAGGDRAGVIEAAKQDAQIAAIPGKIEATTDANIAAAATKELPAVSETLRQFTADAKTVVEQLESGELNTGYFRGQLPAITTNEQLFDVFSGEQILEKISSATFGALSEGEREFLKSTVSSRTKTPAANIAIIKRKIDILTRAERRAREQSGQSPTVIDFNDLPTQ